MKEEKILESEDKSKIQRETTFNGMSANEWATSSKSVWKDLPFPRSDTKVVSDDVIDEEVFARIIFMYSKEGDTILDPKMNYGNSIIASIHNDRHAIGLEKDENKYKIASNKILNALNLLVNSTYNVINSNIAEAKDKIEDESVQLALTTAIYNKDENKEYTYQDYLKEMEDIFINSYSKIKQGGYFVLIVKDFRDLKNGQAYVEAHNDIARLGQSAGFSYQDVIIYDHNESRGLLLLGYPKIFYVNLNHSYVVVLRKN